MGFVERLLGSVLRGNPFEMDDEEAPYRCIQCGAGYPKSHKTCSSCGSQFIAKTDAAEDAPNEPTDQ